VRSPELRSLTWAVPTLGGKKFGQKFPSLKIVSGRESRGLLSVTGLEGPTTLRVRALEAIDGTPIIDLTIAMRESPEA
jgi:hypothetical protein